MLDAVICHLQESCDLSEWASQDLEIHDHVGDAGLELEEAESVPNAVPGRRAFTNDVHKISGYFNFLPASSSTK